jgi:hypothetical protein
VSQENKKYFEREGMSESDKSRDFNQRKQGTAETPTTLGLTAESTNPQVHSTIEIASKGDYGMICHTAEHLQNSERLRYQR